MDYSQALIKLKHGQRLARAGWNGKGMYLELQVPDAHSKMTLPYIFMKTVDGDLVPWVASQTDTLAEDWQQVPDAPSTETLTGASQVLGKQVEDTIGR